MSHPADAERASLPTTGAVALPSGTAIDRFVIDELLAEGEMARIYRGHDAANEPVALKVLRSELARPRDAVERFALEARACGELRAPNVPRLLGSGRLADGAPYLVLTYFGGPTLETALQAGTLSVGMVLQLGAEIAAALHDVHTRGFVHCDIRPANIILCEGERGPGGRATGALIDFGTCRRLDSSRSTVPPIGTPTDSPLYMSPEQLQGGMIGARSDVFALGVVLYRALTGRQPFAGTTAHEVTFAIWHDPIVPVTEVRADCPQELDRALMRALRREPSYRWASTRRFGDELSWLQARYGFGLLRSWQEELRPSRASSDKHRIDGIVPAGSGVRRRA